MLLIHQMYAALAVVNLGGCMHHWVISLGAKLAWKLPVMTTHDWIDLLSKKRRELNDNNFAVKEEACLRVLTLFSNELRLLS